MSDYIDGFMDGCGEASANPEAGEDNWHSIAETYDAARSDRDPEQPSVDWLDPARESCLIDGVRYERAGWREVEVDLHGPEIYDDEYTLAAKYDSLLEDLGVGPGESVTVRILVPASPEPDKETP